MVHLDFCLVSDFTLPFRWPLANMSSVSASQKDTERAAITLRNKFLLDLLKQLERVCTKPSSVRGLQTAESKVNQSASKSIKVLVEEKYGVDLDEITNPWHAAVSSFFAFSVGSLPTQH